MIVVGALLAFSGYYFLTFINVVAVFGAFTLAISYTSLVVTDKYYGAT